MKHPTNPKVFRFLDLPAEIRNKIYGNLLIHNELIKLEIIKNPDDIGKRYMKYVTRLKLFPQICRTSKTVACESFAVLYGENMFHFTNDNDVAFLYHSLGLEIYSHFIKNVVVDTFDSEFDSDPEEYTNLSGQTNLRQEETLRMQSAAWAKRGCSFSYLKNVKKLCLSLPRGLEILTDNNKRVILDIRRDTPKDPTVEFCGATSDIVAELMIAWPLHVPQEVVRPAWKCVHRGPCILLL